jgi:hypothetical protein
MIKLRFCTIEFTATGAITRFEDGTSYGALPHDEPHYHAVAHRLGYQGDILLYCQEHEHAHALIAEEFGSHSPVIWALAHGENPPRMIAAAESFVLLAFHWKHQAAERGEKLAVICQFDPRCVGQSEAQVRRSPAQIKFMGEAIGTLTTAIHKQNDAVDAMGAETKRQQAEARKPLRAKKRAQGAQATSTRLAASSRAGGPPCEPSKALKGAWQ